MIDWIPNNTYRAYIGISEFDFVWNKSHLDWNTFNRDFENNGTIIKNITDGKIQRQVIYLAYKCPVRDDQSHQTIYLQAECVHKIHCINITIKFTNNMNTMKVSPISNYYYKSDMLESNNQNNAANDHCLT